MASYLEKQEVEQVRVYFELALKQIRSMWERELPPLEARVTVADDAIDFYYEVLGETTGGVLHCSIDDGNLERFESVQNDVAMEREREPGEADEAGIALGELLITGGEDLTAALRELWGRRLDEARRAAGR